MESPHPRRRGLRGLTPRCTRIRHARPTRVHVNTNQMIRPSGSLVDLALGRHHRHRVTITRPSRLRHRECRCVQAKDRPVARHSWPYPVFKSHLSYLPHTGALGRGGWRRGCVRPEHSSAGDRSCGAGLTDALCGGGGGAVGASDGDGLPEPREQRTLERCSTLCLITRQTRAIGSDGHSAVRLRRR